jgi:hypothetical protein
MFETVSRLRYKKFPYSAMQGAAWKGFAKANSGV